MLATSDSLPTGTFQLMLYRMARSARIDGAMFRSLRDDNDATRQSILVLALAGLSYGLGFTVSIRSDLVYVLLASLVGTVIGVGLGFIWLTLTYLLGFSEAPQATGVSHGPSSSRPRLGLYSC
jgi:hypothetical protein